MKPEDRVGTIINGNVKVLRLVEKNKSSSWKVEVECLHCGSNFIAYIHSLISGKTKSCGCIGKNCKGKKHIPAEESIGKTYGELLVLAIVEKGKWGNTKILVECQHCIEKTKFITYLKAVRYGSIASCGCMKRERLAELNSERCGPNNPMWMGGLSFAPYCEKFNDKLKERIRDEYGRQCFLCGKSEEENGRRLSIHHTDYDKQQGCSGKGLALVPLCNSCHSKTNSRREYWTDLFNTALKAIYEVPEDATQ